jgi:hypothetical protein
MEGHGQKIFHVLRQGRIRIEKVYHVVSFANSPGQRADVFSYGKFIVLSLTNSEEIFALAPKQERQRNPVLKKDYWCPVE